MRLAVAQYRIERPPSFDAYAARQRALVGRARDAGAELLLLPEYASLELAATLRAIPDAHGELIDALQPHHAAWLALWRGLAQDSGLVLVPGTYLVRPDSARARNRAYWFAPSGSVRTQDKLALTRFELDGGALEPGDSLSVIEHGSARLALAVCYDVEFPLPVRAQAEAGARVLLVPSCTDTEAGATRVRTGCQARALEQGMVVACAVTMGDAPWHPWLDTNTGAAGVYVAADRGLPGDGVLARADPGQELLLVDLDLDALTRAREHAQVAVARDWPHQMRPGVRRAVVLRDEATAPPGNPHQEPMT